MHFWPSKTQHNMCVPQPQTYICSDTAQPICHNFTTHLGAPALQNLDQWRYAPAILQQWFEGNLGLPDSVGIGLGQRGQEGGQLGGGSVSGRHVGTN